ncbi:MAG: geranylgeranyl reductase family protein [Candidatus Hodarchaeota archaeon]
MKSFYDVIVVGGGPCGILTSIECAKTDLKVCLLEEHLKIGEPPHCAGILSLKGLKLLGLYDRLLSEWDEAVQNPAIKGATFFSPSNYCFEVKRDTPQAIIVDRAELERKMFQHAEKLDIEAFKGARAEKIEKTDSNMKVYVKIKNHKKKETTKLETISSNLVIDAEGSDARLLSQAGLTPPKKDWVYSGAQFEIEKVKDLDPTMVELYLGQKIAPGFFAWIIPLKDENARVGLIAKPGHQTRTLLKNFMNSHPIASKKVKEAKIRKKMGGKVPLGGPIKRTITDNFIVVGDAASQTKSTTGGGVITGGLCAIIAAKAAKKAVEEENFSSNFLKENYEKPWKKLLKKQFKLMLLLRKTFNILSDQAIDHLFKTIKTYKIEKIIEKKGDIDWQATLILTALKNPITYSLIPKIITSIKQKER